MNLLNYIFLAVINGQLTSDFVSDLLGRESRYVSVKKLSFICSFQADRLLQNGISGSQCGDPDYPYLLRVRPMPALPDRIVKDRWSRSRPKRRLEFGQMKPQQMIPVKFDGEKAIYGSCTSNSFSRWHIKWNTDY